MALTLKQRLFVEAYLGEADGNATEAARIAGYSGGDNTLAVRGSELVRNRKVAELIGERIQENQVNTDYVIAGVKEIADSREERTGDRLKAYELLGKYLSIWTENARTEMTVNFGWKDEE